MRHEEKSRSERLTADRASKADTDMLARRTANSECVGRNDADLLTEFDQVAHLPGYKRAARKVLAGWRSWSKARDLYRGISVPVTLIYGDTDWSHTVERDRTRSLIPQANLITLKDTGHFSAVENPGDLARIILAD